MAHRYKHRIERFTKPEKFDQNCHRSLPGNALQTLQHWNNHLDLDEKSQATRSDYLEKASIFLRNADKTPDEVEKQDVIDFLSDRSSSGRRTYKATLRQFFLWYYLDYKEMPEDELPRFVDNQLKVSGSSGQDKVKKEDIPKEDEVKSLLETAWNHRDRALIAVLADRRMRISEALALDIKDVNFDQAGIYLMVPEAKKDYESYRKNRLTWSRPALKDWLETHPRRDEEDAPLKGHEETFAIDTTGFSESRFGQWKDHKYREKQEHRLWRKLHVCCGVRSNIITSATVTQGTTHDQTQFQELVEMTDKYFDQGKIVADKAYNARVNYDKAKELGAKAYIPFKSNVTGKAGGSYEWMRMYRKFQDYRRDFLEQYHLRSNVESSFNVIKEKFGKNLRCKDPTALETEVLAKVLCYNICTVIRMMYELDLDFQRY